MKLGHLEFHIISAGSVFLDGGAMFGVIPKPMWEKKCPADSRNRIELAMNCLLIQGADQRILVETGAGDKLSPKLREIYGLQDSNLLARLRDYGLSPEDIDIVIDTHLHFDHCGGNTRVMNDQVVATFPNARYIVQKGEYEHALRPTERDRASYFESNYAPVAQSGQLQLIEGRQEIVPGIEVVPVPGHTANMQCVKLAAGGKTAFFLADLVPTTAHLPLPWIMGYDLYPMTTLENRKKWLPQIVRDEWLALFAHDRHVPAAYLRAHKEHEGQWEAEPVKVD